MTEWVTNEKQIKRNPIYEYTEFVLHKEGSITVILKEIGQTKINR